MPSTNFVLQQSPDLISWNNVTNNTDAQSHELAKSNHPVVVQRQRVLLPGNSLIAQWRDFKKIGDAVFEEKEVDMPPE
jgi:hypothetical protein